jgi:pyruvate dehydrogenase E2 component (dihydrolipoamide acetyltransferase)
MREAAITMPKLSMTMEEGEVIEWEVVAGAEVAAGDVVCRVMTDKTEMDVEAPAAGRLVRVVVEPGHSVEVGTTLAYLATESTDLLEGMFDPPGISEGTGVVAAIDITTGAGAAPLDRSTVVAGPPRELVGAGTNAGGGVTAPAAAESGAPVQAGSVAPTGSSSSPARVASVPAARALAGSLGVDIRAVPCPTGGIVTVDDVLAWSRSVGATASPRVAGPAPSRTRPAPAVATEGPGDQTLRGRAAALARATARTMGASAEVPQFTLHRALDLHYASTHRGGVSWNAVLVAAAARALRASPRINGTWTGTDVVLRAEVVLGLAVATDDGLVVVSVPDADRMPLPTLSNAVSAAVERARRNELAGDDLRTPTFTVSNLGGLGVDWFAALVTPPQAAVLSLGRVRKTFTPTDDGFALRTQCNAGLTVDHRVANGADGARYLAALDDHLQADNFLELALGSADR